MRIVSLLPSTTEILFAIGALGLAGAAWVGYWTHRLDLRRRTA